MKVAYPSGSCYRFRGERIFQRDRDLGCAYKLVVLTAQGLELTGYRGCYTALTPPGQG